MDRMPVVLLLGIATSIEIFQDRMPRSALKRLQGKQFEVINSDELLERIFSATILGGNIPFRIGSELASGLIHRQRSYIQSPSDFIDAFQVSCTVKGLADSLVCIHDPFLFKSSKHLLEG
jgi:origin recognition complex subunit 3